MEHSVKYNFFMSQLMHIKDIKETDKTKISVVYNKAKNSNCILRICKGRDISSVCNSLRNIRHPNVAIVYDYVYENGDTYVLEENINGRTVEEIIVHDKVFDEKKTANIIIAVCRALELLHCEKPSVIHNDINPSNIMICDDGTVKLFDFDTSRTYQRGKNQNTVLLGTEEYASPEHFGYGQSEPRTDIYSLGVTMHKMLTGEELTDEHKLVYRGGLKRIIRKCLEIDPKNRYRTAKALKKDLDKYLHPARSLGVKLLLVLALLLSVLALVFCLGYDKGDNTKEKESIADDKSSYSVKSDREEQSLQENDTEPDVEEKETLTEEPQEKSEGEEEREEAQKESDNSTKKNAFSIEFNEDYSDRIEDGAEGKWYSFTTAKEMLAYRIFVEFGSGPYCPTLKLFDTNGIVIETIEVYTSMTHKGYYDSYLEPNTEYLIKIDSPQSVDYSLRISAFECDAGFDTESAKEIRLGKRSSGIIDTTLSDWFFFTVPNDAEYRISCHNIDVGADVRFNCTCEDENMCYGSVVTEDSVSHVIDAREGDKLYIEVKSNRFEADGKYILYIEEE